MWGVVKVTITADTITDTTDTTDTLELYPSARARYRFAMTDIHHLVGLCSRSLAHASTYQS